MARTTFWISAWLSVAKFGFSKEGQTRRSSLTLMKKNGRWWKILALMGILDSVMLGFPQTDENKFYNRFKLIFYNKV